jgi:hypothetical protein
VITAKSTKLLTAQQPPFIQFSTTSSFILQNVFDNFPNASGNFPNDPDNFPDGLGDFLIDSGNFPDRNFEKPVSIRGLRAAPDKRKR